MGRNASRTLLGEWIGGVEPDALQGASPVLNGEREETGEGPHLALTQLPRSGHSQQLKPSVRLQASRQGQGKTPIAAACLTRY